MNLLAEIVENKKAELVERKRTCPVEELRARALEYGARPPFAAALRAAPMGLIAEIKRRSPSAGPIREPLDPAEVARAYEAAGAQAVSVLMDAKYFGGGEEDFRAVRSAVQLPLLYKEFVVDPWQIWHASSLGASAALLIVAALGAAALDLLLNICEGAGIEALVEVHDKNEMEVAAACGAKLIGINNRNLKTFKVSLDTTLHLADKAPAGATLVSESGIGSAKDVQKLKAAGVHAVLVGEHLLRQPDLAAAVRDLMTTA
ncbi:MAG: indole-3-glycerol phosphate synthase TrpC [Kiritimatiellae bacterium]|nr:indole-3-glycerol phosphate synthase TrpC [Kiritimatiellia bacterium]